MFHRLNSADSRKTAQVRPTTTIRLARYARVPRENHETDSFRKRSSMGCEENKRSLPRRVIVHHVYSNSLANRYITFGEKNKNGDTILIKFEMTNGRKRNGKQVGGVEEKEEEEGENMVKRTERIQSLTERIQLRILVKRAYRTCTVLQLAVSITIYRN